MGLTVAEAQEPPDDLDTWFAEKVMGWRLKEMSWAVCWVTDEGVIQQPSCDRWHPTTDVVQAMQVAERAYEADLIRGWGFDMTNRRLAMVSYGEIGTVATVGDRRGVGPEPSYALCLALWEAISKQEV